MQIEFTATNQSLRRIDKKRVVENSENYLYAHFTLSNDYNGIINAHFRTIQNGVDVGEDIQLDINNTCLVPSAFIKAPSFYVSLTSYSDKFFPSNEVFVPVGKSGISETTLPLPDNPVNQYEEISAMHQEVVEKSDEIKDLTVNTPIIGINNNWWIWSNGQYVDTGFYAKGEKGDTGEVSQEQLDDVNSQLVSNTNQINSIAINSVGISLPSEKLSLINKKLSFPDGFIWTGVPINIYKSGLGAITTDFDASDLEPTGGTTYYVLKTGSDSNNGLTPSTPLANIYTARSKVDVGTIIILDSDAIYRDNNGFNNNSGVSLLKNLSIKATEGSNVIITCGRNNLSFTKTNGYTNVYNVSRTLFAGVYDSLILDSDGDWSKLISKTSIADVDANQGSYYYDTANSMLYIHTGNSRMPDLNITVMLDAYNLSLQGQYTTYLENIKFYGGKNGCVSIDSSASGYSSNAKLIAKNCEFKFSSGGGGCALVNTAGAIFQNCVSAKGILDGFSYHDSTSWGIEIDCIGRNNGVVLNAYANNGSTMHDGGKVISVNCDYHHNGGPNVHDIYEGSQRWCIGCKSHDSSTTTVIRKSNYRVEQGAQIWIDSCIGYGTPSNNIFADTTSKIHIRNSLFSTDDTVLGLVNIY